MSTVMIDLGTAPWTTPRRSREVYVRRRVFAAMLVVMMAAALAVPFGRVLSGSAPGAAPAAPASRGTELASADAPLLYVVRSGDTLWDIATAFAAADNVADFADRLAEINGGARIDVGQVLVLPS